MRGVGDQEEGHQYHKQVSCSLVLRIAWLLQKRENSRYFDQKRQKIITLLIDVPSKELFQELNNNMYSHISNLYLFIFALFARSFGLTSRSIQISEEEKYTNTFYLLIMLKLSWGVRKFIYILISNKLNVFSKQTGTSFA